MKRGGPIQRKTRLQRKTPLQPRPKPPWKGGDAEQWAAWDELRQAVARRAGGRCEAGVTPQCQERGRELNRLGGVQAHHRKLRSQGGPDEVENLLALCGYCHEWAHTHPAAARGRGLICPGACDPATWALVLPDGCVVQLTADGGYRHVMDAPDTGEAV